MTADDHRSDSVKQLPDDRRLRFAAPAALLVLAGVLRVTALSSPGQVVFDEVHQGAFLTAFCCTQERPFDVHPPHGTLALAASATLLGYDGERSFDQIGHPLDRASAWRLRFLPALLGTLLPVLVWLVALQLGASPAAAFFAGLLIALDNAHVVQSRVLLTDNVLVFSAVSSLSFALAAARRSAAVPSMLLAAGSGTAAAMAVGTKLSGASAAGIAVLVLLLIGRDRTIATRIRDALVFGVAMLAIYVGGWAVAFALTPELGKADEFLTRQGAFLPDLLQTHRTLFHANWSLPDTHPYASRFWAWPWIGRTIFYWSSEGRSIYFVGNPAVWWGSAMLVITAATTAVLSRGSNMQVQGERDGAQKLLLWVPLVAFAGSYLPFAMVGRILFAYLYLLPLVFAALASALFLDRIGWITTGSLRSQPLRYFVAVGVVVLGFLAIAPITYGWPPLGEGGHLLFKLFPSWS